MKDHEVQRRRLHQKLTRGRMNIPAKALSITECPIIAGTYLLAPPKFLFESFLKIRKFVVVGLRRHLAFLFLRFAILRP